MRAFDKTRINEPAQSSVQCAFFFQIATRRCSRFFLVNALQIGRAAETAQARSLLTDFIATDDTMDALWQADRSEEDELRRWKRGRLPARVSTFG